MASAWKSTYDRHDSKALALADARRRRAQGNYHRTYAVRSFHDGDRVYWVVYYKEKD